MGSSAEVLDDEVLELQELSFPATSARAELPASAELLPAEAGGGAGAGVELESWLGEGGKKTGDLLFSPMSWKAFWGFLLLNDRVADFF